MLNHVHTPNLFIYNALIRAYSRSPQPRIAFRYFALLLIDADLKPDPYTFNFLLIACGNANELALGRQIHSWVVKNGVFLLDTYVQTGVIRLYVGAKVFADADKVFDEIPSADAVKWNVLMDGYVRFNLGFKALKSFREMLMLGVEPDEFCVTTALAACAQSGALVQGKWIHEYAKKKKFLEYDVFVGTALVDMYAKCGCVELAVKVFDEMPKRNVFSWAAVIGGLALHGCARDAIHCLERMQKDERIRPDGVVILGVLMACTHAGLVEEGKHLLNNMEREYRIRPKHEHYSCVVDLLCRAGHFDEALFLIQEMPMRPLASVWGAVLNSCRIHKNVEVAELAVEELLKLVANDKDEEDAAFVQLSNIYFSAKRSEDAVRIRRMIGSRGLTKVPGCSMIEVDGSVNEFVSGDVSHRRREQIHVMLVLLSCSDVSSLEFQTLLKL